MVKPITPPGAASARSVRAAAALHRRMLRPGGPDVTGPWRAAAWVGALGLALLAAGCGGGGDAPSGRDTPEAAASRAMPLAAPSQSRWGAPFDLGFVPSAAANVPGGSGEGAGRVILWSAENRFTFSDGGSSTWTAMFDPLAGTATAPRSDATGHNMFCPGTTNLPDGRLLVNGGSTEGATSLYSASSDSWSAAPGARMVRPRAYHANTLLRDGTVLTLGGSWDGGIGGKGAEVWTASSGWRALPGVPVTPFLTADSGGEYRSDNHMWLIPTANGRVLHAGPSRNMHWIDPRGNGAYTSAGRRADDADAMQGSAVMYEPGRILVTGGAPEYVSSPATRSAFVVDTTGELSVTRVASMTYTRVFHNSVVLPNGQVMVIGGKHRSDAFNDDGARLIPELWDPATRTFTPLPAMSVPRTYHGVAILLPDARVLSAGSGLCGCGADQPRAQVFTPHYLLNDDGSLATRPRITSAPSQVEYGAALSVTTDTPVNAFALVRLSSSTHTVNNDQRRIPLVIRATSGTSYTLDGPTNPGIALPGHYMLFALDAQGVPSLARTVRIGSGTGIGAAPLIAPVDDASTNAGTPVSVVLSSSGGAGGTTTYGATGLPPGLVLSTSSGTITGSPTTAGTYRVSVWADNGAGRTSTDFVWRVQGSVTTPPPPPPPPTPPPTPTSPVVYRAAYVQIEQLSEFNGGPWGSMAEFNLVDEAGATLSRGGWSVTADSEETINENGRAANVLDGNPATHWHSRYSGGTKGVPHRLTFNLGTPRSFAGFRYLPRQSEGPNGTFGQYRLRISHDGITWSEPVASGDLGPMGEPEAERRVAFTRADGLANTAPTIVTPPAQVSPPGSAFSLAVSARDADFDTLSFSATGLPPGLAIGPATGVISGTPTTAGSYVVRITVRDSRGASATTGAIDWAVVAAVPPTVQPLALPIATTGSTITLTGAAGGAGVTYAWNFGDGSPATAFSASPTVTHTYAAPGLYTVTLTARSSAGATATVQATQAVVRPASAARPRASGPMALTTGAGQPNRLWVVNPDHDTVTVFDAGSMTRLAEHPTGARPVSVAVAPDGRVWVVNREAATLSVFDAFDRPATRTVALPRASRPHGLVFAADGRGYLALDGTGEVLRLQPDGSVGARLPVGPAPRELAITGDGARLLVSRFITPPLPGEGTAVVDVSPARGGEVVVVALASFGVQGTTVLRHSEREDSSVQGRGIPNYLGAPAIAPDGLSAWVPSKQDNVRRGTLRDGRPLDFQNTVRAVTSRLDLSNPAQPVEDAAARVDHDNASLASAAAFHPSGAYLFVALETSRQVAVVDPVGRRELSRVAVGRAPQGLAVSPDGTRLYVANFLDRSVSVLALDALLTGRDPRPTAVATVASTATERLAPAVLAGKQFFYDALDPRLSRDSYMSCASCHRDGGHDGRVWDFTGLGEGLRRTPSLVGRAGLRLGALHWSANFDEVQDFEGQIRALAGGQGLMSDAAFTAGTRQAPLGDRKAGASADLDALAAYVASLGSFAPSPARDAAGGLTADAIAGREVFRQLNCASCHAGSGFSGAAHGLAPQDIGTVKPSSGARLGGALAGLKVPTLRDLHLYRSFLHDGSAATLADAVRAHAGLGDAALAAADPARSTALTTRQQADEALRRLGAYLLQIGGEEPAPDAIVGLQGQGFANASFSGTGTTRRSATDPTPVVEPWLDFDWQAVAPPGAAVGGPFSLRFTGSVAPVSTGDHVFRVSGGGATQLWVDGVAVPLGAGGVSAPVRLSGDRRHDLRLDHVGAPSAPRLKVEWRTPSNAAYAVLPASRLSPQAAPTASAPPALPGVVPAPTPVPTPTPTPPTAPTTPTQPPVATPTPGTSTSVVTPRAGSGGGSGGGGASGPLWLAALALAALALRRAGRPGSGGRCSISRIDRPCERPCPQVPRPRSTLP